MSVCGIIDMVERNALSHTLETRKEQKNQYLSSVPSLRGWIALLKMLSEIVTLCPIPTRMDGSMHSTFGGSETVSRPLWMDSSLV